MTSSFLYTDHMDVGRMYLHMITDLRERMNVKKGKVKDKIMIYPSYTGGMVTIDVLTISNSFTPLLSNLDL